MLGDPLYNEFNAHYDNLITEKMKMQVTVEDLSYITRTKDT